MPKTRSGKIMRQRLASISNGDLIDSVTLAKPEIADSIRHHVQSLRAAEDDDVPPAG